MSASDRPATPLSTPLTEEEVLSVRAGDRVAISGVLYGARDSAHARMVQALQRGRELPFDPEGQIIYYVGPSPAPEGLAVGAAGPTTSARMDAYAPLLYRAGIRATIGKGGRSPAVREAIRECRALYLAAIGGAGALLAGSIRHAEVIAYPDLGPEAVHRLEVDEFPAIVVDDAYGGDLYEQRSTLAGREGSGEHAAP
jgi:fumarate hydratase subunit beta